MPHSSLQKISSRASLPCQWLVTGACPGYLIDHIVPLYRGGPDSAANMQWQSRQEARYKDRADSLKDCRFHGLLANLEDERKHLDPSWKRVHLSTRRTLIGAELAESCPFPSERGLAHRLDVLGVRKCLVMTCVTARNRRIRNSGRHLIHNASCRKTKTRRIQGGGFVVRRRAWERGFGRHAAASRHPARVRSHSSFLLRSPHGRGPGFHTRPSRRCAHEVRDRAF